MSIVIIILISIISILFAGVLIYAFYGYIKKSGKERHLRDFYLYPDKYNKYCEKEFNKGRIRIPAGVSVTQYICNKNITMEEYQRRLEKTEEYDR